MSTIQDIMDLSRKDLNDDAKARYLDADMLTYVNDGIARTYEIRPDLKYGSYGTAYVDLGTAATFPLPIEYRPKIANYVTYRCQTVDDPFVATGLASQTYTLFLKELLGA